MKFESVEAVQKYASDTNKVLVINNDEVLDVTTFAKHHPGTFWRKRGGAGLVLSYQNKDLSHELKSHHILTYRMADSLVIGSFSKEINKLINPNKPLMQQVWNLTHQQYLTLVNSPHWLFVDSPRMFEADWMEATTHNKWYHILTLHLLFCTYLLATKVDW